MAEVVAVVAVVVSVFSLVVAIASARYTKRNAVAVEEANIITRQTQIAAGDREAAATAAALKADVRVLAELRRIHYGTWHVQVTNHGPAAAIDVAIEITAADRQNLDLFVGPDRSAVRAELEAGETWTLPLMSRTDSKDCPIAGNLCWQDNTSHAEAFTITSTADHPPFVDTAAT